MTKRILVAGIALALLGPAVFARGKKEITDRSVGESESWRETFDLTDKKDGKYNIMVRATDKGGNESIGGPFNIWIDPESDLPVVGITNPLANMRVPGNLNIVGTCIDDDAVRQVELVFDGDYENPKLATGKEFWSYYLDTTELAEGQHTIEVYGTDINGLRGHTQKVIWNLDRRQPVTQVTNYGLGTLVSGKINLKGTVHDGNGIKYLSYSLDGGNTFIDTKLDYNKNEGKWTFDVPVDTRESKDGPAVCWFRATDNMGSSSIYSFLYFIDNTKPDVKIVSPLKDEVVNGHVGISGYAKDVIGIQKLTWSFNGESGDFELIPGNPYWYKEVDTTGLSKKTNFTITATDTVGNTVVVNQELILDQEADKPVVTIEYPAEGEALEGKAGTLFVRGIVTDDDGVASVEYSLDGGETLSLEAQGVFYAPLSSDADLSFGKHFVTVTAVDKYGIKGNPVTAHFVVEGTEPVFENASIKSSEGTQEAVAGMIVHPESDPVLLTSVSAPAGIKAASYKIQWGTDGLIEKDISPEKGAVEKLPVSINLSDAPWGLVRITVSATDIYDRTSQQVTVINMKDLTTIHTDEPAVVFDDSVISEHGDIINDPENPVTGYFVGGNARSASLVPDTGFAKVELIGNQILLHATNAKGTSPAVKVRVMTDQGLKYESRELIFHSRNEPPVIELDYANPASPRDGFETVRVSGTVTTEVPLANLSYRIISVRANMNGILYTGSSEVVIPSEFQTVDSRNNSFGFDIDSAQLPVGMHIVELCADNGQLAGAALFINKMPKLTEEQLADKKNTPKAPVISWIDGVNVYYTVTSQLDVDVPAGVFLRSDMKPGSDTLTASAADSLGKTASSKYTAKNDTGMKASFVTVADKPYRSGMNIYLPRGEVKQGFPVVTARFESAFPITSVNWEISGEKVSGGAEKQNGKSQVRPVDEKHYEADIPLQNLPSRITKITVTGESSVGSCSYTGYISVLRERESSQIDSSRKVYWIPEHATYDGANDRYLTKSQVAFEAYANVPGPVTATVNARNAEGLSVTAEGNLVKLVAEKDGSYNRVTLTVRDSQGAEYTTSAINLLVDSEKPVVEIKTPAVHQWVQNELGITVNATDVNGIVRAEYSLDRGVSWSSLQYTGGIYRASVPLTSLADGEISLDVRAVDASGLIGEAHSVVQKDTTPPEVQVIIPAGEDIVNGENRIVFSVRDNGALKTAEYQGPATKKVKPEARPLEIGANTVTTFVGTTEQPISDLMTFNFADEVGNVTTINTWDFIIDAKSDLPVAEVHLPEENAVITRDFTISGVIYDDDGPSKVWFKIDNSAYQPLPEYGSSFTIDVPLSSMTDNEHEVTVYAEDIHGVKGPEFVRHFKVSLEEPKGEVLTPPISETVKGTITFTGKATDKNGISKVYVSVDNGNSYNEAVGTYKHELTETNWSYTFDTRVIQDGTHVVFLKIVDWYGIEGIYSSLVNIDNTAPQIDLQLPLDGSKSTGMVFFSGQTTDNVKLEKLYISIRSLEGKTVRSSLERTDLIPGEIITQAIDLSSLNDGFYNIELVGTDAANNTTRVSRNIQLDKTAPKAKVDLLYPLNGEKVRGEFNIYGTAVSEVDIHQLTLYIDGTSVAETTLSSSGYYKFHLDPTMIPDGTHTVKVVATLTDSKQIVSNEQYLIYNSLGPWVTIDNFTYGDFAVDRPYLRGEAGYTLSEDELVASKMKGASKELKAAIAAKTVEKVELSLNNGKTFETVSTNGKWRYRIENKDIAEGYHFLLVRATMKNGETAITRTIVQVDSTAPTVRLISPGAGGRYNQELIFSGLTHDDVALKDVTLYLRKGDKSSYEVPAFIQGLYFDWQFWGATLFNIGAGLTFFDDNVKLQVQWGQFTEQQWSLFKSGKYRYGGDNILGAKLLANVYYLPFRYLLGPDWEWLSMNVALGANFTRFNDSGSGKPQILSAALAQLEFPRVTLTKQKMFRTIAFYTEGQLWFIPSDVAGDDIKTIVPQISFGLRVNVF